jgi:hypothetical protein
VTRATVRPWFCRLVDALPAPPFGAVAVVIGGVLAVHLLALLGNRLFASVPIALDRSLLLNLVLNPAGIAYFVVLGGWFVIEGGVRDLRALGPCLRGSPEDRARQVAEIGRHPRGWLFTATVAAPLPLLVLHGIAPGTAGPVSSALAGEPLDFPLAYRLAAQILFWMVFVPVVVAWGIGAHRFWRCGRHGVRVDLLDPGALSPFARFGLRLALVVLAIPILMAPAAALGLSPEPVEVLLYLAVMGLGLAAMLIPSLGLHRVIREAKAAELARVRGAIRGDRSALAGSPLAPDAERISTVELALWRDRIESLREWPFDASLLRRFGIYLLIPLASWVGAALVERLVDRLVE